MSGNENDAYLYGQAYTGYPPTPPGTVPRDAHLYGQAYTGYPPTPPGVPPRTPQIVTVYPPGTYPPDAAPLPVDSSSADENDDEQLRGCDANASALTDEQIENLQHPPLHVSFITHHDNRSRHDLSLTNPISDLMLPAPASLIAIITPEVITGQSSPIPAPPPTPAEPDWHEYRNVLSPEDLAYQTTLLESWSAEATRQTAEEEADEAHLRAVQLESELEAEAVAESLSAEERAHIRAVELESELLADTVARNQSANNSSSSINSTGGRSLLSPTSILVRGLRSLSLRPSSRLDINRARILRFAEPESNGIVSSNRNRIPSPPPHREPNTDSNQEPCALCDSTAAGTVDYPQFLDGTRVPCVCCQACLDEILSAEAQATEARG